MQKLTKHMQLMAKFILFRESQTLVSHKQLKYYLSAKKTNSKEISLKCQYCLSRLFFNTIKLQYFLSARFSLIRAESVNILEFGRNYEKSHNSFKNMK